MKWRNFSFFILFVVSAAQALEFEIGDYVDCSQEDSKYKEFGTVQSVSIDGILTIRPHGTMQGDFKVSPDEVTLIKKGAALRATRPKNDEYSINIVWVNKVWNKGEHIFPNKILGKKLAQIAVWAKMNPYGTVILWYDSAMSVPDAMIKTKIAFAKKFPDLAQKVFFADLRDLPEVANNSQAFSPKIPLDFRIDLFTAVMAYNTISGAASQGLLQHCISTDIDVRPMNRAELFDNTTMMDLERFGIVMTQSKIGEFDNLFQIWSTNKPNLLKAAKAALIDVNIARAKHILRGGTWGRHHGKTEALKQKVYESYQAMFRYFYHLERWGVAKTEAGYPILEDLRPLEIFGLTNQVRFSFDIKKPDLRSYRHGIRPDGKGYDLPALYIPRKLIKAQPLHAGRHARLAKDQINLRNFAEEIDDVLDISPFDGGLLQIAAMNDDLEAVTRIANKLSPADLIAALLPVEEPKRQGLPNTAFRASQDAEVSKKVPFVAFKERPAALAIILKRLQGEPDLLEQVAEAIANPKVLTDLVHKDSFMESLKSLFAAFSPHLFLKAMVSRVISKGAYRHSPLHEAIVKDRVDLIELVYLEYAHNQELLEAMTQDLLLPGAGMRAIFRAKPATLGFLRTTFLKDKKQLEEALFEPNGDGLSCLFLASGDGKVAQIRALAQDLLDDQEFMKDWALELLLKDHYAQNAFHKLAAQRDQAANIRWLGEQFAIYRPKALREALEMRDIEGRTPREVAATLDLAGSCDEKKTKTIDQVRQAIDYVLGLLDELESASPPVQEPPQANSSDEQPAGGSVSPRSSSKAIGAALRRTRSSFSLDKI